MGQGSVVPGEAFLMVDGAPRWSVVRQNGQEGPNAYLVPERGVTVVHAMGERKIVEAENADTYLS